MGTTGTGKAPATGWWAAAMATSSVTGGGFCGDRQGPNNKWRFFAATDKTPVGGECTQRRMGRTAATNTPPLTRGGYGRDGHANSDGGGDGRDRYAP